MYTVGDQSMKECAWAMLRSECECKRKERSVSARG